jgi:hypothetical protein
MEAVAAAMEPRERSIGWIVAPTYDLAARIMERVRITVHQHLKHRLVLDDQREQRIVIRNLAGGLSEIRGKSCDNPVSLLGEGLDWLIVEEAARLKASIWESYLASRLVDRQGWALLISTPAGADSWFYRMFDRGRERGGRKRDPDFESWNAPSWENPMLNRAAIEEERAHMSPEAFGQEFEGKFLGEDVAPCAACGWPALASLGGPVVVNYDSDLIPCPRCGGYVDKQGRTIMSRRDGRPYIFMIDIRPARRGVSREAVVATARIAES